MYQEMIWTAIAVSAVAASAVGDIESNDPEDGAKFGWSISLHGFTYAIGAPEHAGGGRVELRSVVQGEHDVLENPAVEVDQGDGFGYSLALGDSICVVGSPGLDDVSLNSGGAWVYQRMISGWTLLQPLHRDGMDNYENFGTAVATRSNRIFVGAPGADWNGNDGGKVYVYEKGPEAHSWSLRRELYSGVLNSGFYSPRFGESLATDGRFLAVGAPGMNPAACFLFRTGGFSQLPGSMELSWRPEMVEAPSGGISSQFGASVAIEGNLLVVGAPGWYEGSNRGAIFIYRLTGGAWQLQDAFYSTEYSSLGTDVSIVDGVIIAGDPDAGTGGRIHVYLESDGVWIEQSPQMPQAVSGEGMGHVVAGNGQEVFAGSPMQAGGLVRVLPYFNCIDCDGNGSCDQDEIDAEAWRDCNEDGFLDVCQELLDCDGNGVPDVCEVNTNLPRVLPENGSIPVELLLLEDTSGSTTPDRAIVCEKINEAIEELNAFVDLQITTSWTRIAASSNGDECIEGVEFPIPQDSAVPLCGPWGVRYVESTEDWGDAISFAVSSYQWGDDGLRFVLIMTDEGPSLGDSGGDCGSDDQVSLDQAAQLAGVQGVQLFPVPLPGTDSCLFGDPESMMEMLAQGAAGSVLDARELNLLSTAQIVAQLFQAIEDSPYVTQGASCAGDVDGDGMVDANDLLQVISDWGMTESPADLNEDGLVDASDLLEVIAGWGLCG